MTILATILAKNVGTISKTQHEIPSRLPNPMQCCHVAVFMYSPNDFSGYQYCLGGGGGGGGVGGYRCPEIIGQDCRIMCTEGLYLLIAVKATAFSFTIWLQVRMMVVVLRAPLPMVRQVQTDLLTLDCLLTGVQRTECWLRRVRVFSELITVSFLTRLPSMS